MALKDPISWEEDNLHEDGDNALMEAKLLMATGRTSDEALQLLYNAVNSLNISQESLHEAVHLIRRYS